MRSTTSKNKYNLNPFDWVVYMLNYGLYLIEVISRIESHETLMHVWVENIVRHKINYFLNCQKFWKKPSGTLASLFSKIINIFTVANKWPKK
jgi:hypothetical protein